MLVCYQKVTYLCGNQIDELSVPWEVNYEMPVSGYFDDEFDDLWNEGFFKKFFNEQRRVHRELLQQIKRLQGAVKSGKLKGKTEFSPIEKPGVRGFVFRGTFGTPETSEEEGLPGTTDESIENKESFVLPEDPDADEREPVVETFLDGKDFVALVELPGAEDQEIRIETGDTWVRVGAINFKTTEINVPSNADKSKIVKKYRNGVLEIRMPLIDNIRDREDVKYRIV
jgi:HSP20 family molecular chaperone IbpA